MGLGLGGSSPSPPPVPPPVPTRIEPEVDKAKKDLLERLKRARARALSRQTEFGLLVEKAPTYRPTLSDILG